MVNADKHGHWRYLCGALLSKTVVNLHSMTCCYALFATGALGNLNICNHWILLRIIEYSCHISCRPKMLCLRTFFGLKVNGIVVNRGICFTVKTRSYRPHILRIYHLILNRIDTLRLHMKDNSKCITISFSTSTWSHCFVGIETNLGSFHQLGLNPMEIDLRRVN